MEWKAYRKTLFDFKIPYFTFTNSAKNNLLWNCAFELVWQKEVANPHQVVESVDDLSSGQCPLHDGTNGPK